MHAKTDSEVTSSAPSSPPPASPSPAIRPAYYVQSPSRDGDKTTTAAASSFHSTPILLTPSTSPLHSQHSSTRFSSSTSTSKTNRINKKKKKQAIIEDQEGLLLNPRRRRPLIPRRCYVPLLTLTLLSLFFLSAIILCAVAKSQKPHVHVTSVTFHHFNIHAGTDDSGVPTSIATLNSTVSFTYYNSGTFFAVHVSAAQIGLSYSMLRLGTGHMEEFWERRRSQRGVSVVVVGERVPLYGAGKSMTAGAEGAAAAVGMTLSFMVRSRAYVLGKLVKPRFENRVWCGVVMDPTGLGVPVSLASSCQYYSC